MLISTLLAPWIQIPAQYDADITDLTLDSRAVVRGSAFIALQGQRTNGADYIHDAVKQGAQLILIDDLSQGTLYQKKEAALYVSLPQLIHLLPAIAERFYKVIESGIKLIGVTGTNGKTSCTHFLSDIYQQAGVSCGIIGTLGSGFYGALQEGSHTTPDILTLYKEIKRLSKAGAKRIAMEVSSHSIHQKRIAGLPFEIALFTNLTQDHLDYHGDMETYAGVKYQFLEQALTKQIVINADDSYGKSWVKKLSAHHEVIAFGVAEAEHLIENSVTLYAKEKKLLPHGMEATVCTPLGDGLLAIPLLGEFNLSNALAVLSALLHEGMPLTELLSYFKQLRSVPGRMQLMGGGDKPSVVIDYAHTPDALEKALRSLRRHATKRLICVFGCGGDRDPLKRPLMGQIATQFADHVVLTNDNPRSEDPLVIIDEIKRGIADHQALTVIPNRSKAIQSSIQYAGTGDVILVAGKGAERFQYIGNEVIPFEDATEVQYQLSR